MSPRKRARGKVKRKGNVFHAFYDGDFVELKVLNGPRLVFLLV